MDVNHQKGCSIDGRMNPREQAPTINRSGGRLHVGPWGSTKGDNTRCQLQRAMDAAYEVRSPVDQPIRQTVRAPQASESTPIHAKIHASPKA